MAIFELRINDYPRDRLRFINSTVFEKYFFRYVCTLEQSPPHSPIATVLPQQQLTDFHSARLLTNVASRQNMRMVF